MGNVVKVDSIDVIAARTQLIRDKQRGLTSDWRIAMIANARPIDEYDDETLANPGEVSLVVVDDSELEKESSGPI